MSHRNRGARSLFDEIASIMIEYIEEMADTKRGLRADYADIIGQSKYRNRDFENMVVMVEEQMDDLMRRFGRGGRLDEIAVLEQAVPEFIDGHFAFSVVSDPRVFDRLPRDKQDAMEDVADQWEREWTTPSRRERGGRGRDREEPRRGGSRYNVPAVDRSSRGRSAEGGRYNVTDGRQSRYGNTPVKESTDHDPWAALTNRQAPSEEPEPVKQTYVEEPRQRQRPEVDTSYRRTQGIDYSKARPYDSYWIGDEEWVAAHLCTWELKNPDRSKVPTTFYDINTSIRYLVRDNAGQIREEFIAVTEDNRYLSQELLMNEPLAAETQRSTTRITAGGGRVSEEQKAKEIAARPTPIGDVFSDLDLSTFKQACEKYSVVVNLSEAAQGALLKLSNQSPDINIVMMPYLVKDPVVLINYTDEVEVQVEQLATCNSLHELHAMMVELKAKMLPPLWEKFNDRITSMIKTSARYQWQFGMKHFDFVEHLFIMLEYMKKTEGDVFLQNFVQRSTALIEKAGSRFSPQEALNYIIDQPRPDEKPNAVVFADFEFMFAVRSTADQLGIGKQLEKSNLGVSISQLEPNLKLMSALRNIYRNLPLAERERSVQVIRLVTADNYVATIYPYMCRQDQFILSQSTKR